MVKVVLKFQSQSVLHVCKTKSDLHSTIYSKLKCTGVNIFFLILHSKHSLWVIVIVFTYNVRGKIRKFLFFQWIINKKNEPLSH